MSFTAAAEEVLEKPCPVLKRKLQKLRDDGALGPEDPVEWAANQATPISEADMHNVYDEQEGEQNQVWSPEPPVKGKRWQDVEAWTNKIATSMK